MTRPLLNLGLDADRREAVQAQAAADAARRRQHEVEERLERLARRLADHAGLPIAVARRRVASLAISAQPRTEHGREACGLVCRYG
jgi:hypothetical protein